MTQVQLTREETRKVASLARLNIPEEDLDRLSQELSRILGQVQQLADVDVEGVEPLYGPHETSLRLLPDGTGKTTCNPEDVLANAPDARGSFFVVPKVIE